MVTYTQVHMAALVS